MHRGVYSDVYLWCAPIVCTRIFMCGVYSDIYVWCVLDCASMVYTRAVYSCLGCVSVVYACVSLCVSGAYLWCVLVCLRCVPVAHTGVVCILVCLGCVSVMCSRVSQAKLTLRHDWLRNSSVIEALENLSDRADWSGFGGAFHGVQSFQSQRTSAIELHG
ncbi:hypothetical protein PoB_007453900 [Plakobranchus ocellatus]|uniref:Uncharacterized protein n=1 Tax=Plakobranchus ocellatus TaxID=259542 RepID=A0AAV4DV58_9GAST|nr:hypothetical protein PoB_007453900 [Plakobranchus ocellatus]